jgi:WD40 repeat protein
MQRIVMAMTATVLVGKLYASEDPRLPPPLPPAPQWALAKTDNGRQVTLQYPSPAAYEKVRLDEQGDPLPPRAWLRVGSDRFQCDDDVNRLYYTRDGRTLISQSLYRLQAWDAWTGAEVRFKLPTGLMAMTLSSDGKLLAGMRDKSVILWDVAAGKEIKEFPKPVRTVGHYSFPPYSPLLLFSDDGKFLAHGDPHYDVRIWETASGKLVATTGDFNTLISMSFAADGKSLLLAGMLDSKSRKVSVRMWSLTKPQEIQRFENGHVAAFIAARQLVAVATSKDGIGLFDCHTGKAVGTIAADVGHECLVASPDGRILVVAGNRLRAFDVAARKEVSQFSAVTGRIRAAAISPDGRTLAYASAGGGIRIVEMASGKHRNPRPLVRAPAIGSLGLRPDATTPAQAQANGSFALRPHSTTLAVVGQDRKVHFFDWNKGTPVDKPVELASHAEHWNNALPLAAYSPDGQTLAVAAGRNISLLDSSGKLIRSIDLGGEVTSLSFLADGRTLVYSVSTSIGLHDLSTGKSTERLLGSYYPLFLPGYAGRGKHLVTVEIVAGWRVVQGFEDRSGDVYVVRKWLQNTSKELLKFKTGPHVSFAISPDETRFATVDEVGDFHFFDLATWEEVASKFARIKAPATLRKLSYSPDGKYLIGAITQPGAPWRLVWWAVADGKEHRVFQGDVSEPNDFVLSTDGKWAATLNPNRTVLVFNLDGKIAPRPAR